LAIAKSGAAKNKKVGGKAVGKTGQGGGGKVQAEIGIIGGSGLYAMAGLEGAREVRVRTPFGDPSDALMVGTVEGRRVAFLARHGRGHVFSPT
jgi:purine nucleoside phosphorylase